MGLLLLCGLAPNVEAAKMLGPCGRYIELPTNTSEPVFFTIFFDKTGSCTLRAILGRHLPDDFTGQYQGTSCAAPARPSVVSTYAMSRYEPPHTSWDACDVVAPRPCGYVALFRDPIARLMSAYNYFCVRCAENGRECGKKFPDTLRCPNMTLTEYAAVYRELYVRALSNHGQPPGTYFHFNATRADFDEARRWILETRPFVMVTQDLSDAAVLGALADFLGRPSALAGAEMPVVNAQPSYAVLATDDEIQRLRDAHFYWDTQLYNWLRDSYVNPSEPLAIRV